MAYARKGRDNHPENEGQEKKKGMSSTEIAQLMKRVIGSPDPTPSEPSPLMPNAKGGKGGPLR